MDLLIFLLRSSRRMLIGIVAASIVSGALGAGLIAVINRAMSMDETWFWRVFAAFVAVTLGKIAIQFLSQIALVRFAQDTILRLSRTLCVKILGTPYEKIEAMGSPRLLAALTEDVAVLSAAVQAIPTLATNAAVIAGCSIYLMYLSWPMFLMSMLMVAIGVVGYRVLNARAFSAIVAARDGRDRLLGDFRALIEGVKELKLHRARREQFMRDAVDSTTNHLREQNLRATTHYMIADAWSQLLFFALIAVLLFVAPSIAPLSTETMTGYIFASLYMMAPVWAVVGTVPTFMRGRASLAKIRELGDALSVPASEPAEPDYVQPSTVHIEFDDVCYSYPSPGGDEEGFTLGPINLMLESGQVVFLTGGNGSGKSTLVKLITGLYTPHSGTIRLNGQPIDDFGRERFRENFSAVFADFHLFDQLFGLEPASRQDEISRYLGVLRMEGKVQVRDGKFSTIALSTGQRKRLALLTAYLEDRPIYVFDEWAADQDPGYKEIFYARLLPELKQRGKCVIVVTHDDRYFGHGDRVVKLENGMTIDVDSFTSQPSTIRSAAPVM
jgi:putative ATP-binding cassette transporter